MLLTRLEAHFKMAHIINRQAPPPKATCHEQSCKYEVEKGAFILYLDGILTKARQTHSIKTSGNHMNV